MRNGKDFNSVAYTEEVKSSHSDTVGLYFVFFLCNEGIGVMLPCEYLAECEKATQGKAEELTSSSVI